MMKKGHRIINRNYDIFPVIDTKFQLIKRKSDIKLSSEVKAAQKKAYKNPYSVDILTTLGRAYVRQNLYREAIDVFSKAMCVDLTNADLYRFRGHAYLNIWCHNEAVVDFSIGLKFNPKDFDMLYLISVSYYLLENYENTVKHCERALLVSESPSDEICTLYWYYLALVQLRKHEQAKGILDSISHDLHLSQGGTFYKAILLFKDIITPIEALEIEDSFNARYHSILYYSAGIYYYHKGQAEKGDRIIKSLLAYESEKIWASYALQAAKIIDKKRNLQ